MRLMGRPLGRTATTSAGGKYGRRRRRRGNPEKLEPERLMRRRRVVQMRVHSTAKVELQTRRKLQRLSTFFAERCSAWQARKKYPRPSVSEVIELLAAYYMHGRKGFVEEVMRQHARIMDEYPRAPGAQASDVRAQARALARMRIGALGAQASDELGEEGVLA